MSVSKVIIISGPPCTGKTTLAKKVASVFGLPIVSCDSIREILFDIFNCSNLVMFRKDREAGFAIMFNILKLLFTCNQNLIIDSTFWRREVRKELKKLQKQYKFKSLQINLKSSGIVLWDRYQERVASGHRHKGYLDHLRQRELRAKIIKGFSIPPKLKGKTIKVDTTDFTKVDYRGLIKKIKIFLAA
ncbi:MAG: AAA family ATPase [Patescibacteria group bacterium]|nr:AAA family ATPase [Patescibacteria group bacterium]MDD5121713.1 AAA family ATPase [Patescibacteria group bacterium]MDD5221708.1 AAA family ATPase [Patescibacteria group bacterium]MDD5396123.1 AAA family ATPase [Patescibacteria group bacterium]